MTVASMAMELTVTMMFHTMSSLDRAYVEVVGATTQTMGTFQLCLLRPVVPLQTQ